MPARVLNTPRRAVLAICALLAASHVQAATLYDGALGSTPAQQGWAAVIQPFASQTVSGGGVKLDTTFQNSLQSGYSLILPNVDSDAGYSLSLTVQLHSESHTGNSNRAGFSVILLDNAHKGIEVGFWTDSVWTQSEAFIRAESAAFNTTDLTDYVLTLQSGSYSLSVNNSVILNGVMRDYSTFGAPYTINNFLFIGDDTSSAGAKVQINQVSSVPEPSMLWLMLGPALSIFKFACRGATLGRQKVKVMLI